MTETQSQNSLRRTFTYIASLIFIGSLSPTPVQARAVNAKCLLQIDGTTYMDGSCHFSNEPDSDFFLDPRLQITCPNGMDASKTSCSGAEQRVTKPGVFGFLRREKDVASLCWNMGTLTKANPCFQGLRRSGACWSNPSAKRPYNPSQVSAVKFCAWR